jgi:hypothetical protein
LLVIPAKAGIQHLPLVRSALAVIPAKAALSTAKLVIHFDLPVVLASIGFHSPSASGSLFFECPKKSNQKKCTPDVALSASLRVRERRSGFA